MEGTTVLRGTTLNYVLMLPTVFVFTAYLTVMAVYVPEPPDLLMLALATLSAVAFVRLAESRVVADDDGLTLYGALRNQKVAWADFGGVQRGTFLRNPPVDIVTKSGQKVRLPAMCQQGLPRILERTEARLTAAAAAHAADEG